jgi:DNA modification methylase
MPDCMIHNDDFRNLDMPKGLIITDPPYNIDYKYDEYSDKLSDQDYISLISAIPKPCVIINYPEESMNYLPFALGKVDEVFCWIYETNTKKHHRLISFFGCKPDRSLLRRESKYDDPRYDKDVASYDWWKVSRVTNTAHERTDHPCQIPEEIIKNILIVLNADLKTTIIDPFLGSGTTGKVALEMGYDFWGSEISPNYYNIAKKRLQYYQLPLIGLQNG